MRVIFDGTYVTDDSRGLVNIVNGLFTTTAPHGYSVGDWIYTVGDGPYDGPAWIINSVPSSTTFTVIDLFGGTPPPGTFNAGGTLRVYTVVSPYAGPDLPFLKFTQSADTMTICCVNQTTLTEYLPYDLVRHADNNWVFTAETFKATIQPPTSPVAIAFSSNTLTTWYSYVITAVDNNTGEESNPSAPVTVQNNDITLYQGTNSLSWNAISNATSYNIYAATPSFQNPLSTGNLYGFIGTSLGTNFNDTNIIPDFSIVPPEHFNPFARGAITDINMTASGVNYSQQTVGYSVTTSTGAGFSGQPVVSPGYFNTVGNWIGGSIQGFVISNQGEGYLAGDTINFIDSGGGVATGTITFSSNPVVGDEVHLNGVILGLQAANDAKLGPFQIPLGNTELITAQNIANYANASQNGSLIVANYTAIDDSGTILLCIQYHTSGTNGNDYTLGLTGGWGTPSAITLTGGGTAGTGATATLTVGPQSGTYPSVVAYYQQRRVYANSLNNPDTYWMSQPGLYTNMDTSIPVTDADAVTGTPWSKQVNGISWLLPMPNNQGSTGMVTLTGNAAWQVTGGSSAAITPSNQVAIPQAFNGANSIIPPIPINFDILYVQSKGSIVRDLAYSFFLNIYTGTDLTVFSDHLFLNYNLTQWAWAEEPFKLLWAVRNDGVLLCLTYLKESNGYTDSANVFAWTRHDTNGLFVSVASVTEPPTDAVYVVVQRYVKGAYRYYVERLYQRLWNNVEQSFCVDSGLLNAVITPAANLLPQAASGDNVTFKVDQGVWLPEFTGQIVRGGGGIGTILNYDNTFGAQVEITQPFNLTVPDNPNNMVEPIPAGLWFISPQITQVTGLNHLAGLEVTILADGSVVPNQIVTELTPGVYGITLPHKASQIVVGLPYTCQLQTLYIDQPRAEQSIQTKRKTISAVGVRVQFTRGIQVGANQPDASVQQNFVTFPWTNMIEVKTRNSQTNMGNAEPLYTGDYYETVIDNWNMKGQIAIQQTYPLPAKILAVVPYYSVGDSLDGH